MREMCKIMSAMEKVSEDVVGSVSSSDGMEKGRKPKEDVGESFKTQHLSHYPVESHEECLVIEQWVLRSFLG